MIISKELSKKISDTLQAFVANPEPFILKFDEPINLRRVAQDLNILPLSLNFTTCYAVRPNGEVVVLDFDDKEPRNVEIERDPRICALVLCQGAKKFPELIEIVPPRPLDADDCLNCNGTGVEPLNKKLGLKEETIICWCGGLGWIPKNENWASLFT